MGRLYSGDNIQNRCAWLVVMACCANIELMLSISFSRNIIIFNNYRRFGRSKHINTKLEGCFSEGTDEYHTVRALSGGC